MAALHSVKAVENLISSVVTDDQYDRLAVAEDSLSAIFLTPEAWHGPFLRKLSVEFAQSITKIMGFPISRPAISASFSGASLALFAAHKGETEQATRAISAVGVMVNDAPISNEKDEDKLLWLDCVLGGTGQPSTVEPMVDKAMGLIAQPAPPTVEKKAAKSSQQSPSDMPEKSFEDRWNASIEGFVECLGSCAFSNRTTVIAEYLRLSRLFRSGEDRLTGSVLPVWSQSRSDQKIASLHKSTKKGFRNLVAAEYRRTPAAAEPLVSCLCDLQIAQWEYISQAAHQYATRWAGLASLISELSVQGVPASTPAILLETLEGGHIWGELVDEMIAEYEAAEYEAMPLDGHLLLPELEGWGMLTLEPETRTRKPGTRNWNAAPLLRRFIKLADSGTENMVQKFLVEQKMPQQRTN